MEELINYLVSKIPGATNATRTRTALARALKANKTSVTRWAKNIRNIPMSKIDIIKDKFGLTDYELQIIVEVNQKENEKRQQKDSMERMNKKFEKFICDLSDDFYDEEAFNDEGKWFFPINEALEEMKTNGFLVPVYSLETLKPTGRVTYWPLKSSYVVEIENNQCASVNFHKGDLVGIVSKVKESFLPGSSTIYLVTVRLNGNKYRKFCYVQGFDIRHNECNVSSNKDIDYYLISDTLTSTKTIVMKKDLECHGWVTNKSTKSFL